MLGREHEQARSFFKRNNQRAEDAVCLARAKFYTDLNAQVSYGLLSIADANKQVEEYNHPTKHHS